jgi:glycosyltransferase involved in cell wall biosynthesis
VDAARRYMTHKPDAAGPAGVACHQGRMESFLRDCNSVERAFLLRRGLKSSVRPEQPATSEPEQRQFRIVIIGGHYEHHHNVLCFFNYLDRLAGTGFATYKVLCEPNVKSDDLIGMDLAILSRLRGENTRHIVEACRRSGVPSMYMLDDNWLSLGRDWPEFSKDFRPGAPQFEAFLYAARNCDVTLTYNKLLIEDLAPIANNIVTLPNSVDLDLFDAVERPTSQRFVVGYAGSLRYTDAAFAALAAVARLRPDVDLLVFGDLSKSQRKLLELCKVDQRGFLPYEQYVRAIRNSGVDILLSPADDSRTSRSKCPNKYLEITAAGAVGIYSELEPYVWRVKDGVNGRLVSSSAGKEDWISAILSLLDKAALARMSAAARQDVEANNSVGIVAAEFRRLICRIAAKGRLQSHGQRVAEDA